jgi:KipI family sensor histidine kinase inhibitor
MRGYKFLHAGDMALVVEFGDGVDRKLNQKVLALAERIEQAKREGQLDGVIETVPTFRSLMIYYEPLRISEATLTVHIEGLMKGLRLAAMSGRAWRLPVCYDASVAPDLEEVAYRTKLSPAQVIECHSAVTYHVYMLGFLPGQAYMGDVPAALDLPRRESPRLKIPPGSLAITMNMTCIFPLESPCGWHLIGRSPVRLWDSERGGALLAPGDQVTFAPVSLREYEDLYIKAATRALEIAPLAGHVGAAA